MALNELLLNDIKQFLEDNSFIGMTFDNRKAPVYRKPLLKLGQDNAPTTYKLFLRATIVELKARENAKAEGEKKLRYKELFKEATKMWKEKENRTRITYQLFLRVTLAELKARENAKAEGEKKLRYNELFKEAIKMWNE